MTHCDTQNYDLSKIDALKFEGSPWVADLISVYKNVYNYDCMQALKAHKGDIADAPRGLPDNMIANSKSLKSFFDYLIARGNIDLKQPIEQLVEETHINVFGPLPIKVIEPESKSDKNDLTSLEPTKMIKTKSRKKLSLEESAYLVNCKIEKPKK